MIIIAVSSVCIHVDDRHPVPWTMVVCSHSYILRKICYMLIRENQFMFMGDTAGRASSSSEKPTSCVPAPVLKKLPAPGVHFSCLNLVLWGSVWRSFVSFTIHQLVLLMWQFVDKLVSYMAGWFVVWFQQVDAIRQSFAEGWWFDWGLFSLTKMDIRLVMLEIECPTFIQQVRAVYQWVTLSTLCLASVKCLSLTSSYIFA